MPLIMSEATGGVTGSQSKNLSPAVSRAMEILRLVAANPGGVTLARVCRESGIAKNSVFRILNTLTAEGVLQRDSDSQQFTMTGHLLGMAYRGTGADALSEVVMQPMRQLRDKTGETVLFGKLLGTKGVVLEQFAGIHPIKVQVETGVTFPLHSAAPAKAILASLPLMERERICRSIDYTRFTGRTIDSADAMLAEIEEVERTGIAYDRGEEVEDIRCVGSVLIDHRNLPVGAIWITGPASRLTDPRLEDHSRDVLATARFICRHLGGGDH